MRLGANTVPVPVLVWRLVSIHVKWPEATGRSRRGPPFGMVAGGAVVVAGAVEGAVGTGGGVVVVSGGIDVAVSGGTDVLAGDGTGVLAVPVVLAGAVPLDAVVEGGRPRDERPSSKERGEPSPPPHAVNVTISVTTTARRTAGVFDAPLGPKCSGRCRTWAW